MYKLGQFAIILISWLVVSLPTATYAAETLRDPTQPPPTSYSETPPASVINKALQIDAIFVGKKRSAVIIGGKTFAVGDRILGATIIEITSHAVKLKDENGEIEIVMPYSNIKSPITNKKEEKP